MNVSCGIIILITFWGGKIIVNFSEEKHGYVSSIYFIPCVVYVNNYYYYDEPIKVMLFSQGYDFFRR